MSPPITGLGQISILSADIGLNLFQNGQICMVFVENHDVGVVLGFQVSNEVLTNKAGAAGKNNFTI